MNPWSSVSTLEKVRATFHCARADHVPFLPLQGTADGKTASPLMPGTSIAALDALLRLGPNTQ